VNRSNLSEKNLRNQSVGIDDFIEKIDSISYRQFSDDENFPYEEPPARTVSSKSNESASVSAKVSTGCGPSPPREIQVQAQDRASIRTTSCTTSTSPLREIIKQSAVMKKTTGTSPPPQSISTQVYK
jgi:hypothetical protein